jgi:5-formyltetrahydrofolate cyclo-ligase
MTKEEARIFQKKRILDINNRNWKEEKIREKIIARFISLRKVIGYRADKWEVDLDLVWIYPELKNVEFYFPSVVSIQEKKMEFVLPEYWEKGSYGIMEPRGKKKISQIDADITVIPSLGFQKQGFRLGRGAGFYDRAFSGIESKKMIGICFSELFSIDFPSSEYDIRVGEIVTDSGVLFF